MNSFLAEAKRCLEEGNFTCAAYDGEKYLTSMERGVAPLLNFIDSEQTLFGYSVADRVVGRAAAFLYIKLKAKEIYAGVISRPALEIFREYNLPIFYGELVDYIINRTNTGLCPMEESVLDVTEVDEAENRIRQKLASLKQIKPE